MLRSTSSSSCLRLYILPLPLPPVIVVMPCPEWVSWHAQSGGVRCWHHCQLSFQKSCHLINILGVLDSCDSNVSGVRHELSLALTLALAVPELSLSDHCRCPPIVLTLVFLSPSTCSCSVLFLLPHGFSFCLLFLSLPSFCWWEKPRVWALSRALEVQRVGNADFLSARPEQHSAC
jgi:hypothetical protein